MRYALHACVRAGGKQARQAHVHPSSYSTKQANSPARHESARARRQTARECCRKETIFTRSAHRNARHLLSAATDTQMLTPLSPSWRCIRPHTDLHARTHKHAHTLTHAQTLTNSRTHTHSLTRSRTRVRTHIHTCVRTHTNTHMHRQKDTYKTHTQNVTHGRRCLPAPPNKNDKRITSHHSPHAYTHHAHITHQQV
jgi:hypothetical protein